MIKTQCFIVGSMLKICFTQYAGFVALSLFSNLGKQSSFTVTPF